MNNEELILKLKKIVKPYVQNDGSLDNISEDTDFVKDLKINSANLIDIVLDVESEFNIQIDDDSMIKMTTVKDSIGIINNKLLENDRK